MCNSPAHYFFVGSMILTIAVLFGNLFYCMLADHQPLPIILIAHADHALALKLSGLMFLEIAGVEISQR